MNKIKEFEEWVRRVEQHFYSAGMIIENIREKEDVYKNDELVIKLINAFSDSAFLLREIFKLTDFLVKERFTYKTIDLSFVETKWFQDRKSVV